MHRMKLIAIEMFKVELKLAPDYLRKNLCERAKKFPCKIPIASSKNDLWEGKDLATGVHIFGINYLKIYA